MKLHLFPRIGAGFAVLFLAQGFASAQVTVLTAPFDPNNPTTPHTTYPLTGTTESTIILLATVPSAVGSTDKFQVSWNFGDGSAPTNFALTNPYDISTTHQYPASAATGTQWTAVVTVTDTTTNTTGSANYYVIQEQNILSSRVNVAIDWGLSYMHRTMWRGTTTISGKTVPWGGWDTNVACTAVNGQAYDCDQYGVINADNVQAFEVNNHLPSGPATDPYTDDVIRGLNRSIAFLTASASGSVKYLYNPATVNYGCSTGYPTTANPKCASPATQVFYNASATSCTSPPCTVAFDGNNNKQLVYYNSGEPIYTTSPFMDALVASKTPSATAQTGGAGILGQTYLNLVQDMADFYNYSQYGDDYDLGNPAYPSYYRGGAFSASGGAWLYNPQEGDDNSTSQWAAIGLISAERGFGITIPQIVKDANNVWVTNAQDLQSPAPAGTNSFGAGDNAGAYGYRGAFYYSNAWGPFAVTPSGMVQMAFDGVGRTTNTAFGDATTDPDQRWNNTETFYADNFCNATSGGAYYAPRNYVYGLFSFTKAMLLHAPGGMLSPILYLRTQTPNVFKGNSNVPPNTIDWYGALSAANGGTDPCDGVAQTLVSFQASDGHWYGNNYDGEGQDNFETAWALIMLQKTIFGCPINNFSGAGASAGTQGRVDLSWTSTASSTSYTVLRSSTSGTGYTSIGTTMNTSFSDPLNDNAGVPALVNGSTYYYVVQPNNGSEAVCQSTQVAVTVPKISGRH
jgi:hypothetical protein